MHNQFQHPEPRAKLIFVTGVLDNVACAYFALALLDGNQGTKRDVVRWYSSYAGYLRLESISVRSRLAPGGTKRPVKKTVPQVVQLNHSPVALTEKR